MHSQQDNGQRVRGLANIYVCMCMCVWILRMFPRPFSQFLVFFLQNLLYLFVLELVSLSSVCAHKFNYTSSVKSSVCETDRVYFILGFSCIFLFRHSVIKRASRYVDTLIASARRLSIKHLSLFPLKFLIMHTFDIRETETNIMLSNVAPMIAMLFSRLFKCLTSRFQSIAIQILDQSTRTHQ